MTETVLLRDLAQEVGGPDRAVTLLNQVRAQVSEDPLGRLVVPTAAAIAVRDVIRDERAAEIADQAAYNEWRVDRETRRRAIATEAHERALARALVGQRAYTRRIQSGELPSGWATGAAFQGMRQPDPSTRSAARQAKNEAVRKFDEAEPDMSYGDWQGSKVARRWKRATRKGS